MAKALKKIFRAGLKLSFVYLAVSLTVSPRAAAESGQKAVLLCINTVIPSLFPFLICSGYLSRSGMLSLCSRYLSPIMRPLFKLPGSSVAAFVLGIVSGYPIGAVCAADLYKTGECSRSEAERMCVFCNNSGPLFVVSVIGMQFLGSTALGWLLYASLIASAVFTGAFLGLFSRPSKELNKFLPASVNAKPKNILGTLGLVMDSSTLTMLKICGFIVFFSVFAAALPQNSISPYIHSLIEITGGIKKLAELRLSPQIKLPLISFFLAFSGVSVFLQVGAVLSEYGLSLKTYLWGKLFQAGISSALTWGLIKVFPQTVSVFSSKGSAEYLAEPLECLLFSCKSIVLWVCIVFTLVYAARFILQKCRTV